MCPDGQACLQADCSYCAAQCHLLIDTAGAEADDAHARKLAHSHFCLRVEQNTHRGSFCTVSGVAPVVDVPLQSKSG